MTSDPRWHFSGRYGYEIDVHFTAPVSNDEASRLMFNVQQLVGDLETYRRLSNLQSLDRRAIDKNGTVYEYGVRMGRPYAVVKPGTVVTEEVVPAVPTGGAFLFRNSIGQELFFDFVGGAYVTKDIYWGTARSWYSDWAPSSDINASVVTFWDADQLSAQGTMMSLNRLHGPGVDMTNPDYSGFAAAIKGGVVYSVVLTNDPDNRVFIGRSQLGTTPPLIETGSFLALTSEPIYSAPYIDDDKLFEGAAFRGDMSAVDLYRRALTPPGIDGLLMSIDSVALFPGAPVEVGAVTTTDYNYIYGSVTTVHNVVSSWQWNWSMTGSLSGITTVPIYAETPQSVQIDSTGTDFSITRSGEMTFPAANVHQIDYLGAGSFTFTGTAELFGHSFTGTDSTTSSLWRTHTSTDNGDGTITSSFAHEATGTRSGHYYTLLAVEPRTRSAVLILHEYGGSFSEVGSGGGTAPGTLGVGATLDPDAYPALSQFPYIDHATIKIVFLHNGGVTYTSGILSTATTEAQTRRIIHSTQGRPYPECIESSYAVGTHQYNGPPTANWMDAFRIDIQKPGGLRRNILSTMQQVQGDGDTFFRAQLAVSDAVAVAKVAYRNAVTGATEYLTLDHTGRNWGAEVGAFTSTGLDLVRVGIAEPF